MRIIHRASLGRRAERARQLRRPARGVDLPPARRWSPRESWSRGRSATRSARCSASRCSRCCPRRSRRCRRRARSARCSPACSRSSSSRSWCCGGTVTTRTNARCTRAARLRSSSSATRSTRSSTAPSLPPPSLDVHSARHHDRAGRRDARDSAGSGRRRDPAARRLLALRAFTLNLLSGVGGILGAARDDRGVARRCPTCCPTCSRSRPATSSTSRWRI